MKASYTTTRKAVDFLNTVYETIAFKEHDYERVIEAGEKLLKKIPDYFLEHEIPDSIGTEVFGMHFPSPVILSSFKGDMGVIEQYMKLGLGGATIKTVKPEKHDGNKRPRIKTEKERVYNERKGEIYEYESIFNRMGLPSPGAKKVRAELEDSDIFSFDRPIGISIGGETVQEYLEVFKTMRRLENEILSERKPKSYYEINASCPNTGKTQLCEVQSMLEELLSEIRKIDNDAAFFVKLSPDMKDSNIVEIADLCTKYGMGLTLGNTHKVVFGNDTSTNEILYCGKSGQALKERTIDMVELVRNHGYSLPVIAIGGISNASDVKEALDSGANLVGMATAVVQNPYEAIVQTNLDLAQMMKN